MKKAQTTLAAVVLGLMVTVGPAKAQQPQGQPQKPQLEGMVLMGDNTRKRGFIRDTNKDGILFSTSEFGQPDPYYWMGKGGGPGQSVQAVAFDTGNDIMRDARASFGQGNYEEAVSQFGKIADGYANMAWVPDGFAAEARYYHIESLRLLNRFGEIAPLLATPTGQAIGAQLGEFYQSQHALNEIWAKVGAEDWTGVKAAVAAYEVPPVGNQEMLSVPVFKKLPSREMVQLAFMRAKVFESEGEEVKALEDYYRTFTLTFGNNSDLAMPAMEAAMAIHHKNPRLGDEKYKNALIQMQSMAYLYKNAFGNGEISSEYAQYAVKPDLPKPKVVEKSDDEGVPPPAEPKKMEPESGDDKPAPAAGDDKPAVPAADDKPAEDDKPAAPAADDKPAEPAAAEPKADE